MDPGHEIPMDLAPPNRSFHGYSTGVLTSSYTRGLCCRPGTLDAQIGRNNGGTRNAPLGDCARVNDALTAGKHSASRNCSGAASAVASRCATPVRNGVTQSAMPAPTLGELRTPS